MKYLVNTENIDDTCSFSNAVFNSLPSMNGLWIPKDIKLLSKSFLNNIENLSKYEIAYEVVTNLVDITDLSNNKLEEQDIKSILKKVCDIPVITNTLSEDNKLHVLETFHGPTLTFKDFGATFLAEYIKHVADENKNYTVLVSTSGDTGSAIASAFHGIENIKVVILYPNNRVSDMQEKQITTYYDNVFAICFDNNFDDCQSYVKNAFIDKNLKKLNLISANSINIARLVPQTLYYFYSYAYLKNKYKELKDNVIFSIPCGNCGNLTGGIIAKQMGLPIDFIASQNDNCTFIDYINTGLYKPRNTIKTISNAIDVGNPSNVKRINHIYNRTLLKECIYTSLKFIYL